MTAAVAAGALAAPSSSPAGPYASNWEHLEEELLWLDQLLELRIRESRAEPGDPLEPWRGLVISEREALRLLSAQSALQPAVPPPAAAAAVPAHSPAPRAGRGWLGRRAAPEPSAPPALPAARTGDDGEARRQAYAALARLGERIAARRQATGQATGDAGPLRLAQLSRIFRLSPLEERAVLLCLAPEVDRRYEKLYAYLADDVTRRRPTAGLVLDLLCGTRQEAVAARRAFLPPAPLVKARLLAVGDEVGGGHGVPLLARPLKLDDRIVDFLLGGDGLPAGIERAAALVPPRPPQPSVPPAAPGPDALRNAPSDASSNVPGPAPALGSLVEASAELRRRIGDLIRWRLAQAEAAPSLFYLRGPYGSGRRELARAVCGELGLPLVEADLSRLAAGDPGEMPRPFAEAVWLLAREATLQPAALSLAGLDRLLEDEEGRRERDRATAAGEALALFSRVTFLVGERPWSVEGALALGRAGEAAEVIEVVLGAPDLAASRALWARELASLGATSEDAAAVDPGTLASRFRFTPGQIRDAAGLARELARWRAPEGKPTAAEVLAACRAQSDRKLAQVAKKVEPRARWSDLVLPADQLAQLREVCDQARFRDVVFGEWGFDRRLSLGKGLNVLFSGPPGTGKTMAAEVVANELGLDLYKIDLSQVVSKYIGETEKNLDRVFAAAESASAILFFDEADALFGKRSEVRDSHDRYANVEVSYLLQKMEEYEGVAILATNLRQQLDAAFLRRISFVLNFPFPDEESRRRIWQGAWPEETPLDPEVDGAALARRFQLAGGNIKNIAVAAAFLAAAEGRPVALRHLLQATRREFQKQGKSVSLAEIGEMGALVGAQAT
jgi:hypothetical protein